MKSTMRHLLVLIALFALPAMASAQMSATPHAGHGDPQATARESPVTKAFKDADAAMMKGMDRQYTGDADRDFVLGMIPHHQGAIDMANVELKYGKDPILRRLASTIIAAQEKEIAELQDWLRRHPASR